MAGVDKDEALLVVELARVYGLLEGLASQVASTQRSVVEMAGLVARLRLRVSELESCQEDWRRRDEGDAGHRTDGAVDIGQGEAAWLDGKRSF